MQVDPINSFSARAALSAREKLLEYYRYMNELRLSNSNYLQELGEGIKRIEAERAKNQAFFAEFIQRMNGGK